MRGHDRSSGRAARRAWSWCILAVCLAALPVAAQDGAATDLVGSPKDPVSLAADTIRAWGTGDTQWLLLQGRAAVLQGTDGVRTDQAVVRVVRGVEDGMPSYRLDVYAEGRTQVLGAQGFSPRPLRLAFRTETQVEAMPYKGERQMFILPSRPRGIPVIDKAFPLPPPSGPAPRAPAVPASVARGSVPPASVAPVSVPPASIAPVPDPRASVAPIPVRQATAARASVPPSSSPPGSVAQVSAAPSSVLPVSVPPASTAPAPFPLPAPPPAPSGRAPDVLPTVARAAPTTVPAGTRDPAVVPTQFEPGGFGDEPAAPMPGDPLPDPVEAPANEADPPVIDSAPIVPNLDPPADGPPASVEPLPGPDGRPARPRERRPAAAPPTTPLMPGSQRVTRIYSRGGGQLIQETLKTVDGVSTTIIRGGVVVVTEAPAPTGVIDISSDSVIIWRRVEGGKLPPTLGPNGETIEDAGQPMEIYMEGNVIIRQDTRQLAGVADQKTYRAKRAFYDMRTGRLVGLDAELDMFAPGLIAPTKVITPRIDQFRRLEPGPAGKLIYGYEEIRADHTLMTGSRFPTPGYRFTSRSLDIKKVVSTKQNPTTGKAAAPPGAPAPPNLTWRFDARQNIFYFGPIPVFYYPRIVGDVDDIQPVLRQLRYGYNNYFGNQVLSDVNGFRLFGIRKPQWVDAWTIDMDYLSRRTTDFPALGTEIGWFGKDFLSDLTDPYRTKPPRTDSVPDGYFGYFDIWGLKDGGPDNLGGGPAIVTSNTILPNGQVAGKQGYQRNDVPAFQSIRGRVNTRHMQSLLDGDSDPYEDFRFQLEAAYISDRHFLEEYYKRLSETGLDQETLGYLIHSKENWAWSIWAEANLQNFYTDTQWLPRLDYYRLGDSLLGNRLTYFTHSGVDYANIHTAVEVNNPNIFAFLPYDPISNTSGSLSSGRFYTNHEIDMPLNFGNVLRFVPYLQGQAVGWNNQLAGNSLGRVWGAAGARADIIAWKRYPDVHSDLLNVDGLNHKVSFEADYRNTASNVRLNQIGVQDDLDDNDYEFVRRYFALTQYIGGVLPQPYDPRHLILRRTISPITGTTDVQGTIQTLQFNIHSRLQTKRGPEGRKRVTDFMTLDMTSTYFPYATRDDFGQSFGQNMYNYQWFLGDRTSIISYGWFEFFKIGGRPTTETTMNTPGYPFGLNMISSGISISRPPRGNVYIGYSVINTGPITTSALNPSVSYWLTPKWYGTFSTSYDFGNKILLASMFSFTRVGADYLTTVGLVVDPQRNNYSQFAIAISPRFSPGIRFGSGSGLTQFDSRFAPTQ